MTADALKKFEHIVAKPRTLYDTITASHPSLLRGRVWCTRCGTFKTVDPAKCLAEGWPRCHGATMTIDSPEERKEKRVRGE